MSRENLDRWCERGILGLVLAILVFGPLATGAVRTFDFAIIQALTAAVVLLWGARLWLQPRPQLLWPPICWPLLAFALYAIARYFTADIEYVARLELLRVLVYIFLFFAILNNLHRQDFTQVAAFTLIFLAMLLSFYALYQFISGSSRVWSYTSPYAHRGSGTFVSPNHLGGFLGMLLPLAFAYTLASRLKPLTRVLLGYAGLAMLAGIVVTVSRGAWLATSLAMLCLFGLLVLHRDHRFPALVLLALLLGAGISVAPRDYAFRARVKSLITQQGQVDDDLRFALWKPALRIWWDHPWWGVGPAHFNEVFRVYRPESIQMTPDFAHNDYLNALTDWGLVGGGIIAAALVCLAVGVWKTRRFVRGAPADLGGKSGSNKFAFVLGAGLGLVAILMHSLLDFNMHIPANAILAVTLVALLTSHLRFATEAYWRTARVWTRCVASAVFVAGAACLGQQAWRLGAEFAWLGRAARSAEYSPEKIDCLKKAFAIEPKNAETAYAIGEAYQIHGREGGDYYQDFQGANYRQLTTQAMDWFARSQKLNPWHGYSFLRYGMCLDWLSRFDESPAYFSRAELLDPNGYFTLDQIGLHYVELGNYAAARPWFQRSLNLRWADNPIAVNYLRIIQAKLLEAAAEPAKAPML